MRIGVDARTAFSRNLRGIGKSLVDLYNHMAATATDSRFYYYYQKDNHTPTSVANNLFAGNNCVLRPFSIPGQRWDLWRNAGLPLASSIDRLDLLHCPNQNIPLIRTVPVVVTIHDVIPLKTEGGLRRYPTFKRDIDAVMARASHVITVSEYSKRDLLSLYPDHDPNKISVIYWAPNPAYKRITDAVSLETTQHEYARAGSPFFFALSGGAPRKNLDGLIRAYDQFCKANDAWDLVIGGIHDAALARWQDHEIVKRRRGRLHLYGYLPEEHMAPLLSAAGAFVYPSLYEGFGLPILDAMACGCPVICSNRTSIPEIAGEAALYVDPGSIDDMAGKMLQFANNPSMAEDLNQRAVKHLEKFTWEKTAEQTLDTFRRVLDG